MQALNQLAAEMSVAAKRKINAIEAAHGVLDGDAAAIELDQCGYLRRGQHVDGAEGDRVVG